MLRLGRGWDPAASGRSLERRKWCSWASGRRDKADISISNQLYLAHQMFCVFSCSSNVYFIAFNKSAFREGAFHSSGYYC